MHQGGGAALGCRAGAGVREESAHGVLDTGDNLMLSARSAASSARRVIHFLLIAAAAYGLAVGASAEEKQPAEPTQVTVGRTRIPIVQACDAEQYDCSLEVLPAADAHVYWAWQNAANHYRLDAARTSLALFRVRQGKAERIAGASGSFLNGKDPLPLLIRRRAHAIYVVVRGRVVLDCLDSTFAAGPVAGRGLKAVGLQPAEDVFFSDDFMRTDKEQQLGAWTKVTGTWQFHSVKETNVHADFRLSVNPFSLGGKDPKGALVTTGFPFWADYEYTASVKSAGAVAGMAFGCQAPNDYFLFRLDLRPPRPQATGVELIRVTPKGRRVLACGTVRAASGEWYRMGVRLLGPRIQAILDGDVLFDVIDPQSLGGPIGLYTEGEGESFFDDVKVETPGVYPFDRAQALQRNGRPLQPGWSFEDAPGDPVTGGSGPHYLVHSGDGLGQYLFGEPGWKGGVIQTRVRAEGSGGWVGVLFGYKDARNWRMARWRVGPAEARNGKLHLGLAPSPEGAPAEPAAQNGDKEPGGQDVAAAPARRAQSMRLQYLRCVGGKRQIVAESPVGIDDSSWHDLQVDCTDTGYTHIYLDRRLRLRVADSDVAGGMAGLSVERLPRAVFGDTDLRLVREVHVEEPISNEVFRNDPYMRLWSSSYGQWFPEKKLPNAYWNKGDFFNSYTVAVPVKPGLILALATDDKDFSQGYRLSVEAAKDEMVTYRVHLSRLDAIVKTAKIKVQNAATKIIIHRSGDVVWTTYDGKELFSLHDPEPLTGRRVGLAAPAGFDVGTVDVQRENIADYPFEEASCDWEQFGNWVVTNRFSCTPTWSHLTALADRACVLWNKYAFTGDMTVEFYAGMRMQTGRAMSYPRIGDMNVSICGDGHHLDSGYSYLVGAWDPGWTEKWTQLLKRTDVVAKTDRYLAPRVRESSGGRQIEVPWTAEGRPIHGAWYYIKLRRAGGRLECFFDNEKVLSYDDTEPLDGRFLALWTQMNEMVVARASITYQHRTAPKRLLERGRVPRPLSGPESPAGPAPVLASSTHPGLVESFDLPGTAWAPTGPPRDVAIERVPGGPNGGGAYLRVTNSAPGADLGVKVPVPLGVDASRAVVQFDYRIPAEAKVHLYVTLGGRRHFIRLNGHNADNAVLPLLGAVPHENGGRWHHATFDLGYAVSRLYPGKHPLPIEEMLFGYQHEGYLRAGIGGNGPGVSYAIDNFLLATASSAPPVLTWGLPLPSPTMPMPPSAAAPGKPVKTAAKGVPAAKPAAVPAAKPAAAPAPAAKGAPAVTAPAPAKATPAAAPATAAKATPAPAKAAPAVAATAPAKAAPAVAAPAPAKAAPAVTVSAPAGKATPAPARAAPTVAPAPAQAKAAPAAAPAAAAKPAPAAAAPRAAKTTPAAAVPAAAAKGPAGARPAAAVAAPGAAKAPAAAGKPAVAAAKPAPAKLVYAFSVDRNPRGEPSTAKPVADTTAALKDLSEGLWFAHIRSREGNGPWSRTAHLPIRVVAQPLTLQAANPEEGACWGGAPVTFRVQAPEGLHPDLSRLAVKVNGQEVTSPALIAEYEPEKGLLSLDLQRAGLSFAEKQAVKVEVQAATVDGPPANASVTLTVSQADDKRAPDRPAIKSPGVFEDFERGVGTWVGSTALVSRDTSTAATGKASLRITNPSLAGSFAATALGQAFNAGRTPLLRFAYRVPEGVCINPAVAVPQATVGLSFTDSSDAYPVIGSISDVKRDGEWHVGEVNLREALSALSLRPDQFEASSLAFSDRAYAAAPPGATYWIDDFQLIPAASGAAGITVAWSASDVTGIQAYRYKWSAKADDTPDTPLPGTTTQYTFPGVAQGSMYLHLQAQDGAGNWSEITHTPFLVDSTAPQVGAPVPAPGKLSTARWAIPLDDAGGAGFDPASLQVTLNGQASPLAGFVTSWDPSKKLLTWDWCAARGLFSDPIPDGQPVEMTLAPVKDFAGNAAAPQTFQYVVDRAGDQEPPSAPEVEAAGRPVVCYDTFTQNAGQWQPYGGGLPGVQRTFDPQHGDYCARLSTSACPYGYWIRMSPFDAVKTPYVAFEYRCPPGVNIHFMLYINGAWHAIPLSGKSSLYTNLTPVAGFKADGQWHAISVNILDILKASNINGASVPITYFAIWHYGSGGGQNYDIDNFQIFGAGTPDLAATWSAVDPTGIHAFRYRIDADPEAGLAAEGSTETAERKATLTGLKPGTWFLRVRARDGAGNWSMPSLLAWQVPG